MMALIVLALVATLATLSYAYFTTGKKTGTQYPDLISRLPDYHADSNKAFTKRDFGPAGVDEEDRGKYEGRTDGQRSHSLFSFDPNTLDDDGWRRLGLTERNIATIRKYQAASGHFKTAEDIKKIYGINPALADKLIPYAHVSATTANSSNPYNSYTPNTYERKPFEKKAPQVIEGNSADTLAYQSLPGIGPAYARRIVNFRKKLGGFHSVEQVKETYGLPDSTFQLIKNYIRIDPAPLRTININTATVEELNHPYIPYTIAKTIIAYRGQHGNYTSVDDLRKIVIITEEQLQKMRPYLSVN